MTSVRASSIDLFHFYYRCPICGDQHKHGSSNNMQNRTEIRIDHCRMIGNRMISIVIDDFTIRMPLTQKQRKFLK